jgi:GTPase SAR1 family protein
MNTYDELKSNLLSVGEMFLELLGKAGALSGVSGEAFSNWKHTVTGISRQITEDLVRVAVVGPIKSGKSTFVNSLFRDDFLKRGAGVITSIVTRIRCGQDLTASLCFKSWDEVNRDIEQGLSFFPSWKPESEDFRFDLRKESHRDMLAKTLASLTTEQLITNDTRNITCVLLTSYLAGYERVKDIICPDETVKHYDNDSFSEHRLFAGDEILAVYIKDIQLEIKSGVLDGAIEIADCQGSDSPNPLHLAMIQDYLAVTHFIVYVVSSRTGLRQADIRFLTMIRDMGIMGNMLFVVNCDVSEHESFEDFNRLLGKIRSEISLIIPDPVVFTVSALYHLFKARREAAGNLSKKDETRLQQWETETEFTALSMSERERFESVLHDKLTRERYALLLGNHVERMALVAAGLAQWAAMNRDILSRDSDSAEDIIRKIVKNQDKTRKVSDMIRSTLDGAVKKVTDDIRRDVDSFFDERSGDILAGIDQFIVGFEPSYDSYYESGAVAGLNQNLYLVYQDFKTALDSFITESVTPKLVGFIKKQEEKILADLDQMTRPYANMVENALKDYGHAMGDFGIEMVIPDRETMGSIPDLETLKSMVNLKYQPAAQMMNYSARVRVEALLKFGMYNFVSWLKKVFKKKAMDRKSDQVQALKDGLATLKRETLKNVRSHFISYRENVKFQYFFKLTDAVANAFFDLHTARFQAYVTDLETLASMIRDKKLNKETVLADLAELEKKVGDLKSEISGVKEKISGL